MDRPVPNGSVLIPANARCVFEGLIYDVYQWPQTMFDGSTATFEMLRRPDTVIIIAVVDNKIILIDDEQPHVGVRLGFPGGRVDKEDGSLLAAAQREMQEETGYTFREWKLVSAVQPHSKVEQFVYCWLAWDMETSGQAHLDPGEKITPHAEEFAVVKDKVITGVSHLGDAEALFITTNNMDELLALPSFS